jgi:tetratricopeptide (TPR) repeat protein
VASAGGIRIGVGAAIVIVWLVSSPALLCAADASTAPAADGKAKAAAYLQAGAAALAAGDHAAAVSYFEKAVDATPGDPAVRDRLADAVRARSQSHGKADALTAAGHAALEAGAFDKAIGYFEKAIEDWRDSPAAREGLAKAVKRQRDSTKARALQLAAVYAERGQWESARDQYLAALAADPDDHDVQTQVADHVARRPLPGPRAGLKAWTEVLNESLPWALTALALALIVVANVVGWFRSRSAIDVQPFDGPDTFRQGTGAAMAAIASSQLHAAGFGLEPGVVAEPFTALSGKLTDPQAKLLADIVAWLFPSHGFRLQAIVFDLPGGSGTRVTAKLIRSRFWAPRERVVATITFGYGLAAPTYETLARLTAAWAEWHVTHA